MVIVLIFNIIWEFSHYSLYIDLSGIPKNLHLILASFMDMFYIIGVFLLVSLKNKEMSWINKPAKSDYFLIISVGIVIAISIESWALSIGRWEYKDAMPLFFGIGLSPLIQLAVTSIISLYIINKLKFK